jgi:hypothetical protein
MSPHSPVGTPSPPSLIGNLTGEITIQELLADNQLVPGMRGAYVRLDPGQGARSIHFVDISQLTINHAGAEFVLTRETVTATNGRLLSSRYRLYSGAPDQVFPPAFRRLGPNGEVTVERILGHSHPFPIPFFPGWNHPSWADIQYLQRVRPVWQAVYGAQSEPFGRIFGLPGAPSVIYGPRSTQGHAVYP